MADKDKNYNDTQKKEESHAPSKCCGVAAQPGVLFNSQVICAICPKCKSVGTTEVTSSWSCKSYLCCYYYGCYWSLYQLIKGKDFTMKNGLHKCSNCKEVIHNYDACDM